MSILKKFKQEIFKGFKINRENNVNIWTKEKRIKFRNNYPKIILIELVAPEQHFYFLEKKFLNPFILNKPDDALAYFLNRSSNDDQLAIIKLIEDNEFFYFNGKKVTTKELYLENRIPTHLFRSWESYYNNTGIKR